MSDVMKADHAASQMTRKAQTLLVMCGIWPARRETRPVSLYDCVRGAQSRIVEFGRIEVHGGQTLYVVPPAVEGLMHSVAELLENATVFSPSRSQVAVSIREVGAGAVIEIDDAGLGMPQDVLQQALGQLRDDLDLARLGAVPRLGLACVGRWSRELGLNVELSGASAYGGTRAVMFVPFRLLTEPLPQLAADRRPAAESAVQQRDDPVRAEQPSGPGRPAEQPVDMPETAGAGVTDRMAVDLPRRRSRRVLRRHGTRHRCNSPLPGPRNRGHRRRRVRRSPMLSPARCAAVPPSTGTGATGPGPGSVRGTDAGQRTEPAQHPHQRDGVRP
ncbi:ATP-binding protein [Streptomyces sp. M10(2022)]